MSPSPRRFVYIPFVTIVKFWFLALFLVIPFPIQPYLIFYSFCTSLRYWLIIWLSILSLSSNNLHLPFHYILSIFSFIKSVLTHTDHLISARRPDLTIINKRKRTCRIVDFAVQAEHRIKLKECEKKDKYLDLARELNKLWNMQVTIIPIVIGTFGIVIKGLLKGLEDLKVSRRVETFQTNEILRTARILRRVLETWGDLLTLKLQWRTIS